ncbi:MAG: ABC transporter permease, partial [Candidatus Omnitrophica bacterium]|nr:ABC transporter permease [Candidatus Omnitrophota bacterium]
MEYTVYEPEKYVKMGIKVWPMMFRELFASGELIWRLFIRDWSARYRQSLLGYLWAVVPPVVAVATFVLRGKKGVVNISVKDVPYQIYALAGLAVWQLFATGVISGCGSLVNSGGMVNKINISLEALVLSSVAQAIPEFLIKCLLIAAAFPVFRFTPPLACLLFPLAVIPIYVLTAGLSLFLSLVNGVMRDTVNVVTLVTMFLMLLTPV